MPMVSLIPAGDRTWLLGDWELRPAADGWWEATAAGGGCIPPLFARSRESLAWLVRGWNDYSQTCREVGRQQAQRKGRPPNGDPDDDDGLDDLEPEVLAELERLHRNGRRKYGPNKSPRKPRRKKQQQQEQRELDPDQKGTHQVGTPGGEQPQAVAYCQSEPEINDRPAAIAPVGQTGSGAPHRQIPQEKQSPDQENVGHETACFRDRHFNTASVPTAGHPASPTPREQHRAGVLSRAAQRRQQRQQAA